jgi:spermidine synthase
MFTVSGATALIYQVIWSRWLGLVFGNTTTSISIVLASFMLGLALGSWAAGRTLHRISNPMRAYAFLEFGIGLFALCFPFLTGIADTIFAATISTETSTAISMATRVILAFFLLLVPTCLMGATLPFLTDFFHRSPRHTQSWKVGLLYATNTLGAALGIVLAGFLLIELVGVSATTLIAAAMNMIVALIGLRLAPAEPLRAQESIVVKMRTLDSTGVLAIGILTASGAAALASEVLWTRTLESLVGNSTYAFSLIVLLYLVGIAVGSWLMSLFVNRLRNPALWLSSLQMGMGIWIFIALFLFNGIVNGLIPYRGAMVSLSLLFWNYFKVMIMLLPLALLSGACFPLATRIIDPRSEDAQGTLIARAYAWNTSGAVGGSLLAGFLIAPFFDYLDALFILAFLYALTAAVAYGILSRFANQSPRQRSAMIAASAVAIIMTVGALGGAMRTNSFANHFNRKYPKLEVVSHRMGLQGITTVIRNRDQKMAHRLLVNGLGMTIKITDTKMMAHLPMFLHPDPQDTLVICFGMGTTYRSAVSHGGRVTVVELVKEVLDAFESFHDDAPRVRAYPHGRMVVNDGRNFLRLTREKYDVITIDPPPPIDAAGVNNLYSREFLKLSKSRLKKGGIMAHWIPFPGTMSGVDDMDTFNMLFLTFADVFPYVYIQPGYHNVGLHVLGSMEPLDLSEKRLEQLLKNKQVTADLREWDPVPLSHFRVKKYVASFKSNENALVTDNYPRLEFYLLRTWKQGGKKIFTANAW